MRARGDGPLTPVPILLYHGIDRDRDRFSVTARTFARHMDLVAASGRELLTIGRIAAPRAEGAPMPAGAAAVTFDDGTADFHGAAWPVLAARGIPATVYVVTGAVGGRLGGAPMMGWGELAELDAAGVEIGAHGHTHVELDAIPLGRAAEEMVNAKLALEHRLGHAVGTFAYPFGYHTAALEAVAGRAGYASACAVKNRLSHTRDDRFAIARLTVTAATSDEQVRRALAGALPVAVGGERPLTRAWRAYRRARAHARQAAASTA